MLRMTFLCTDASFWTAWDLQKELQAKYLVSSTIRHKGEKGRNREYGLGMFLRENLPEKYGIATGEIIPFKGDLPSPQCDIIIYDRLSFPIIGKSSAVQQVPYEAVYSAIEVRSLITNITLTDTLQKFSSIRQLPRCKTQTNTKHHKSRGPIFVLFGYKLSTTVQNCIEFVRQGVDEDIFLVALDTGFTIWLKRENEDVVPIFLKSSYENLAFFLAVLTDSLGAIDLGTPKFIDFINTV